MPLFGIYVWVIDTVEFVLVQIELSGIVEILIERRERLFGLLPYPPNSGGQWGLPEKGRHETCP